MKETEKMLEIIHNNRKQKYEENLKKEESFKKQNKRTNLFIKVVLAMVVVTVLVAYTKYANDQVNNCVEAGNSKEYCIYAHE